MSPTQTDEAPGRLDLIRRFVNSWDYPSGPDRFAEPQSASQWTAENGLSPITNQADCERLRGFREALRDVIFANNGEGDERLAWEAVATFFTGARLGFRFDAQRGVVLEPSGEGADAVIARLLAIVNDAVCEGTWSRMRACRKDTCRFAYYDHSKNGSRAWCSMAVCGNREKANRRRKRDRAL